MTMSEFMKVGDKFIDIYRDKGPHVVTGTFNTTYDGRATVYYKSIDHPMGIWHHNTKQIKHKVVVVIKS